MESKWLYEFRVRVGSPRSRNRKKLLTGIVLLMRELAKEMGVTIAVEEITHEDHRDRRDDRIDPSRMPADDAAGHHV